MDIVDREPSAGAAAFVGDRVNRHGSDFNRPEAIDEHGGLTPAKDATGEYCDAAYYKNSKRQQDFTHSLFRCSHVAVSPCLFRNPNIEYRNPKQTAENSKIETARLLAFPENGAKDVH